jgi:hypothetical protein
MATGRERRLAALAAAFAGGRASSLLSRLGGPRAVSAVEDAGRLASAPRRDRLSALAAAMSSDPEAARASAEAASALERPRVAALLRAMGAGDAPAGAAPPLVRLCRERIGR